MALVRSGLWHRALRLIPGGVNSPVRAMRGVGLEEPFFAASGDRHSYQMDCRNPREAVREALLDVREGADWLMVKPALPYLDVIRAARERFELPLAAYSVSGEYAMLKAAAAAGDLDERAAAVEVLTSIRRAGADVVFTYWAKEFASWL